MLERVEPYPAQRVDKGFLACALAGARLLVNRQHGVDHVRHFGSRKRRTDHPAGTRGAAQRRAVRAAQRDLVPLLPVLVDAENADVAAVVVAAGIDAAADVQVDLAQVMQFVQILVALGDGGRDRDRAGVGQRTEVAARAGDHVGQQPHLRARQAQAGGGAP